MSIEAGVSQTAHQPSIRNTGFLYAQGLTVDDPDDGVGSRCNVRSMARGFMSVVAVIDWRRPQNLVLACFPQHPGLRLLQPGLSEGLNRKAGDLDTNRSTSLPATVSLKYSKTTESPSVDGRGRCQDNISLNGYGGPSNAFPYLHSFGCGSDLADSYDEDPLQPRAGSVSDDQTPKRFAAGVA